MFGHFKLKTSQSVWFCFLKLTLLEIIQTIRQWLNKLRSNCGRCQNEQSSGTLQVHLDFFICQLMSLVLLLEINDTATLRSLILLPVVKSLAKMEDWIYYFKVHNYKAKLVTCNFVCRCNLPHAWRFKGKLSDEHVPIMLFYSSTLKHDWSGHYR